MSIEEIAARVSAANKALGIADKEYEAASDARTTAWEKKADAEEQLAIAQHELLEAAGGRSFYLEFSKERRAAATTG